MTKREQLYAKLENEWKEFKEDILRQPPERIVEYSWEYVRMTDVLDYLKHRIMENIFPYDDEVIDGMLDNDVMLSDICDEINIDCCYDVTEIIDEIVTMRERDKKITKREQLWEKLKNEYEEYRKQLLDKPKEAILDYSWRYVQITDVLKHLEYRITDPDGRYYSDEIIEDMLDKNISLSDICDRVDVDHNKELWDIIAEIIKWRSEVI